MAAEHGPALRPFRHQYRTYNASGATATPPPRRDTSEFVTGQLGLVWKPAENGSIYASYATSATPPGAMLGEGRKATRWAGTPTATATC
jgi:catecholate siderophore receptor